jgi:hypothetical protein
MYEEKVAPFGVVVLIGKRELLLRYGYWKGMLWGMEVYYFAPSFFYFGMPVPF